jgi:hypothetical protein
MIDISFEINGRKVNPNQMPNVLEKAIVQELQDTLKREIGSIRDPKTGQQPRLKVKGNNLNNLSIEVEGTPDVIEAVNNRLKKMK